MNWKGYGQKSNGNYGVYWWNWETRILYRIINLTTEKVIVEIVIYNDGSKVCLGVI
jgi:hypothetical protein